MTLTNADKAQWARECHAQDEGWKLGFQHGRQDRLRAWAGFAIGYLIGRDRHWAATLITWAGIFVVVREAIIHWPIVLFLIAASQVPRGVRVMWRKYQMRPLASWPDDE
jgi:hypothetical protein